MTSQLYAHTQPSAIKVLKGILPQDPSKFATASTLASPIRRTAMRIHQHHRLQQLKRTADNWSNYDCTTGRAIQAWTARRAGTGAGRVFTNSRHRKATTITSRALIVQMSIFTGESIPAADCATGGYCNCTGIRTRVDAYHFLVCSKNGRSSIHNGVRDDLAKTIRNHGDPTSRVIRTEPRGKYFYNSKQGGPDLETTLGGQTMFWDLTAIADQAKRHRHHFHADLTSGKQRQNLLDRVQERTESRVGKPAPIGPIKKRDQEKLNGADAAIAKANGALFTSATFLHSAVISQRFDAALVAYFAHADNANEYVWGPGTIDALDNARQTITASIANHHADYIVANQKAALRARGRSQVELKWWHANTSTAGSFSMDQNVENAAELVQTNNAHHTANTNDDTDHVTDASL